MIHRKSIQSKIWHCCRNCRFWPERKGEYTERNSRPVQGELCDFCQNSNPRRRLHPLGEDRFVARAEVILGDEKPGCGGCEPGSCQPGADNVNRERTRLTLMN